MMDDTLKRLLDAELQAQAIVDDALAERDRIIEQAREEARRAEDHFTARIPEIHASFADKAEERARQAIAEMERRYEEDRQALQARAQEGEAAAIEAALTLILGNGKSER